MGSDLSDVKLLNLRLIYEQAVVRPIAV